MNTDKQNNKKLGVERTSVFSFCVLQAHRIMHVPAWVQGSGVKRSPFLAVFLPFGARQTMEHEKSTLLYGKVRLRGAFFPSGP